MTFSLYLPPQAATGKVPTVYWLSGLTCTDDNVRTRVGAHRYNAGLTLHMQEEYDHSHHFVVTFIGEHLVRHARALRG